MSVLGKHKPTKFPKTKWGKPGCRHCNTEWRIKVPVRPHLLNHPLAPPYLEVSTCPTKLFRLSKNSHILIPSLWTPFIKLTRGISVLYITTNSRKSCSNSHRRIHFFIPSVLINSSTSYSTTLWINKTSITCGCTDANPLTQPFVTVYGDSTK